MINVGDTVIQITAREMATMMRVCFAGAVSMGRDDAAGERTPTPALWLESGARREIVSRFMNTGMSRDDAEALASRS